MNLYEILSCIVLGDNTELSIYIIDYDLYLYDTSYINVARYFNYYVETFCFDFANDLVTIRLKKEK